VVEANADKLERLQRERERAQAAKDEAEYQLELAEEKARLSRSN